MADSDLNTFNRLIRTFQPGEMIFSEFEPGDTFYYIQSGRVKLVKIIGDIERTLDVLQPQDMFGEMAILEKTPRSATAVALDKVTALEFNSYNFESLILSNPPIALKLLRIFARRFYDSKRRLMILALNDPQAKVADVFLMLNETQICIDRNTEQRSFTTTVEDIAHWAGMSVNETRDVINHFVSRRRMEIDHDWMVVRNISDFTRFVNSRRNQDD